MDSNSICYSFESIQYTRGLLDESVDATYVLHLSSNNRLPNVIDKLNAFKPTKQVYICHNLGFKKCKKQLYKQTSVFDLDDTYINIFMHALKNGHNTVLILEDDFIFSESIREETHRNNIKVFLNRKMGEDFVYQLGTLPLVVIPYDFYNYLGLYGGGSHGNIYSSTCMKRIIDDYYNDKIQCAIDEYIQAYGLLNQNTYMYYTPLIYQLLEKTENRENWFSGNDYITQINKWITNSFYTILNMEKTPEPGFSILYLFSKIIPFILLLMGMIVIYYLGSLIRSVLRRREKPTSIRFRKT